MWYTFVGRRCIYFFVGMMKVLGDVIVDLGIKVCICVCCIGKARKSRENRIGKVMIVV